MMWRVVATALILASTSQSEKQFRADYKYNSRIGAFFKFHTEEVTYENAQRTCEMESAKLLGPTPKDLEHAHGILKQFPDINLVWLADDGMSREGNEETTEFLEKLLRDCEVLEKTGNIDKQLCIAHLPFICKLEENKAPYDPICKVYSRGYQYVESVGSCYKISSAACSWNQAYDECLAEGAHLVILNSEAEHAAVHNLTRSAPKISKSAHSPWYWFAGLRAKRPTDGSPLVFKTIFGQTMAEAGYTQWADGEPNNTGNELCGSIFINDGKYNDLDCSHLFAFICEKEINV